MAPGAGELGRRVAVAAVGIPVVLAALYGGGWWFGVMLAAVSVLATSELFGLASARGLRPFGVTGMVASGAIVLIATARPSFAAAAASIVAVLVALAIVTLVASVWLRWPEGEPQGAVAVTLLGPVYVGCTLAFAVFLRNLPAALPEPPGLVMEPSRWSAIGLVLLPLVSVWVGDSSAYFVGRAIGRRKLFPAASPGKTLEGGIAGLVGSAVSGLVVAAVALSEAPCPCVSPAAGAAVGAVIGIAAPLGDVAESVLKREAGVKDSGHLLPGHGGFLDRVDSLLFAFPVAYGTLVLMGVAR
jgi:phosphatidate cytidylyltransferase